MKENLSQINRLKNIPVTVNSQTEHYTNEVNILEWHYMQGCAGKPLWGKEKRLGLKKRKVNWLIGGHSFLWITSFCCVNKSYDRYELMVFKIKVVSARVTSGRFKIFQNKVRNIVNAPWFVRNVDLRRDMEMAFVPSEIRMYTCKQARGEAPSG